MNFVWSQLSQEPDELAKVRCDCWVLGLGLDEHTNSQSLAFALDQLSGGLLTRLSSSGELPRKAGQVLQIHEPHGLKARSLLLVGIGQDKGGKSFLKVARAAAAHLAKSQTVQVLWSLADHVESGIDRPKALALSVRALEEAHYKFTDYRKSEEPSVLDRFITLLDSASTLDADHQAVSNAQAVAYGVALARRLGDEPPNVCTPAYLAEAAQALGKRYAMEVAVFEEPALVDLGANALLAVARGSAQAPKLITLRYAGGGTDQPPVVLVGKGITFDSGGISIKPSSNMDEMKYDMCGAAAVIGVMAAVARLALPLNVVGIIPACENMPGGEALRPGDLVQSMSGKWIEVLNTDAEGRLILCDALTYAATFKPALTIDMATLTGGVVVALGDVHTGLFSNNEDLSVGLRQAGERACDTAWPMPMDAEYREQIESPFADLSNDGGRKASSVTAACFLSEFVQGPWAHLDIAGTAWRSGKPKGATGRPVPMLVQFLQDYANRETACEA